MLGNLLKRALAPQANTYQGSGGWANSMGQVGRFGDGGNWAGSLVNEESTLGVPALWRGVTLISDAIAGLPLHAYRDTTLITPTPNLLLRPNPPETRIETISTMVSTLLVHGNYVAVLGDATSNGYPDNMYPVHPDRVSAQRVNGRIVYKVDNTEYDQSEIFHIKFYARPGDIFGRGVLSTQRQSLSTQIALQEYAAKYFDTGVTPSGVLKSSNPDLNQEEAELLKASWMRTYGRKSREPAVLNATTEFQVLSDNAQESQLIESRTFHLTEAANMLGLPGVYLGAPNSSRTYSNIEQENLQLVRWTLAPIANRIEQTFSDYIPRGQVARFNFDGLLRADTLTRYQAHQIALQNGFMTVDEVRQHEYRDPLDNPEDQPEVIGVM